MLFRLLARNILTVAAPIYCTPYSVLRTQVVAARAAPLVTQLPRFRYLERNDSSW